MELTAAGVDRHLSVRISSHQEAGTAAQMALATTLGIVVAMADTTAIVAGATGGQASETQMQQHRRPTIPLGRVAMAGLLKIDRLRTTLRGLLDRVMPAPPAHAQAQWGANTGRCLVVGDDLWVRRNGAQWVRSLGACLLQSNVAMLHQLHYRSYGHC